jgi:hypothetical protein
MNRLLTFVLLVVLAVGIAAPAQAAEQGRKKPCYWSERFEKGCRNKAIYLVRPGDGFAVVAVEMDPTSWKQNPVYLEAPRELGWSE